MYCFLSKHRDHGTLDTTFDGKMPDYRIANASARDPDRIAKVAKMREKV